MRLFNFVIALAVVSCAPIADSQTKIISGRDADSSIRWMASLTSGPTSPPYCGATRIASNVAVTAAHCVFSLEIPIFITVGTTTIPNAPQSFPVTGVAVHPAYDRISTVNDVALVWFQPTTESTPVETIPIANRDFSLPANKPVQAFGWGTIANLGAGVQPYNLQTVDLKVVDNQTCAKQIHRGLTTEQFCASGALENMGQDTCFGDSGGPLLATENQKQFLAGIVSWGIGCGQARLPGVYTRVTQYKNWIDEQIAHAQQTAQRAAAFARSCYVPTQLTDAKGTTQVVRLAVSGEFRTDSTFQKTAACGDFEFSIDTAGNNARVHDTTTGLVAPATVIERIFTMACDKSALLDMRIANEKVEGMLSSRYVPLFFDREILRPNFGDLKLDSHCSFFDSSSIEVFVSASSGYRAARFNGPAFASITGRVFSTQPAPTNDTSWQPNTEPLVVKKSTAGANVIDVTNPSTSVAFGLFFMCPESFALEMRGSGNTKIVSHAVDDTWQAVGLTAPSQPWSRIGSKQKLSLVVSAMPIDRFLSSCRLNNKSL